MNLKNESNESRFKPFNKISESPFNNAIAKISSREN
jgi:hypothetical protein